MDLSVRRCLPCLVDAHWECDQLDGDKCCCDSSGPALIPDTRTGPIKEDEDVRDPKSTGRKRAAVAFPLEEGMKCEWSQLKFAGGGFYPIVGCASNFATNRHHGPDKNTLNNVEGNVHRICAFCHNRWHARNDPLYSEHFGTESWKAHDPLTAASVVEVLENEAYWMGNKTPVAKEE
jgi:hypothetical protein